MKTRNQVFHCLTSVKLNNALHLRQYINPVVASQHAPLLHDDLLTVDHRSRSRYSIAGPINKLKHPFVQTLSSCSSAMAMAGESRTGTRASIKVNQQYHRMIFDTLDVDNDGFLTRQNLKDSTTTWLQFYRLTVKMFNQPDYFYNSDLDKDGKLSFEEYLRLLDILVKQCHRKRHVMEGQSTATGRTPEETFVYFDSNQDGFLDQQETMNAIRNYHPFVSVPDAEAVVQKNVQVDEGGFKVDLDDFKYLVPLALYPHQ